MPTIKVWYVYILKCSDKTLYTGISTDIAKRIKQHSSGRGSRYVRSKLPVKLVYSERHRGRSRALKREAQIKKLPRPQKLKLISGDSVK